MRRKFFIAKIEGGAFPPLTWCCATLAPEHVCGLPRLPPLSIFILAKINVLSGNICIHHYLCKDRNTEMLLGGRNKHGSRTSQKTVLCLLKDEEQGRVEGTRDRGRSPVRRTERKAATREEWRRIVKRATTLK
ncbi:jg7370 [Pararge aegeria aegeria]|uniref:Jg7370 protein n=1 Tax=Pararge aegeria aegeria TaxID=348720 RepID=A0A8S4RLJ9_9NEOP|nr:jg7370 [Pararge aegeria aegeria]